MNQNPTILKPKLVIAVIVVLLLVMLVLGIDRIGKTRLDIIVIPENATVYINENRTKGGARYLKPGEYTIRATSPGFSEVSQKVSLDKDAQSITLLPEPVSDEAIDWLGKNPDIQLERETLAGELANKEGAALYQSHPILNRLPILYNHGESSIGSGPSERIEGGTAIIIKDTTTSGRASIVQWMREQNYTPGDMEVLFPDFVNPLITSVEDEQS